MIKIKLAELMGARKINMRTLSAMTGINKNSISALYHERTSRIDLSTLNRICKVLDCTLDEVIEYIPDEIDTKK